MKNQSEYKVKRTYKRKSEESGPIVGPNAFGMALNLAQHWSTLPNAGCVTILRADTQGINAGKFFLHQIVKP